MKHTVIIGSRKTLRYRIKYLVNLNHQPKRIGILSEITQAWTASTAADLEASLAKKDNHFWRDLDSLGKSIENCHVYNIELVIVY